MGPCNELVFLGGVERRERSKTTARRGGRGFPGVQQQQGWRGRWGLPECFSGCCLGGQEVPWCELLAVHLETRERELSVHLCLKIPGASLSRRRKVAQPTWAEGDTSNESGSEPWRKRRIFGQNGRVYVSLSGGCWWKDGQRLSEPGYSQRKP